MRRPAGSRLFRLGEQAEVRDVRKDADEPIEQANAVPAHVGILVHDHDVGEEGVDRPTQGCKARERPGEIVVVKRGGDIGARARRGGEEGAFGIVECLFVAGIARRGIAQVVGTGEGDRQILERLGLGGALHVERAGALRDGRRLDDARGEHRIDRIGGNPFVAQDDLRARDEEVDDRFGGFDTVEDEPVGFVRSEGRIHGGAERDLETVIEKADDADGAAAQGEGIG